MPRKSFIELATQADADFPDNITGMITPAKLRNYLKDMLDAMRPAYGYLTLPGSNPLTAGLTPVIFAWTAQYDSTGQTVSSTVSNNIARQERGTCTLNFTVDFVAPANRQLTFTLFKNGVATTWRQSAQGTGATDPVSISFTAVDYADPAATYDIRVQADAAGVSTTMSNAAFILAIDPVNNYQ